MDKILGEKGKQAPKRCNMEAKQESKSNTKLPLNIPKLLL